VDNPDLYDPKINRPVPSSRRITGCLIDPAREVKPRDSAMMENTIGPYKTELIKPRGPWRSLAKVELATAEYVDWYNNKRLRTAIGGMPPVEHEAAYYAQTQPQPVAGPKT
jgi:transposase InsO family protein